MPKKITFIVPVRDRRTDVIQRCVDSLQSKWTKEVIIVDYGSYTVLRDIEGARIIRYAKNKIWNKSHAINLGLKETHSQFVATVDCDMIIHPMFIETAKSYLDKYTFIYTLNIKRLKKKHFGGTFFEMELKSYPWIKNAGRSSLIHSANGGIQIYPTRWIKKIWGLDESLIYWGGIDNDIMERAVMSGMVMINLNLPILHQDHYKKKEEHLTGKEQIDAFKIRVAKVQYLDDMFKKKIVKRNRGGWGKDEPNQKRFLKDIEKYRQREKLFQEEFIKATRRGDKSFEFDGKTYLIFR